MALNYDPNDGYGASPAPRLTGPVTDHSDPRLSDPSYASDPHVLDWINKDLAQKQVAAGNADTPNTPEWQKYIDAAKPKTAPPPPTAAGGTTQPASPVTSTGKIAPPQPVLQAPQLPATPNPTYQPAANYSPSKFSQFSAPNQSGLEDPTSNLLKAIVANPQTMNAGIVSQLKEKSKEEALAMQQQAMQQYGQGAVARGTVGAGDQLAFNSNTLMDTIGKILNSNRGIDIQAVSQNRADELQAANAADSFLSNQLGRATSGYGATLAGQSAQENANQFGTQFNADQAWKAYQAAQAGHDSELQRVLSQYGIDSDAARFNEATSQFDQGHDLDLQRFLETQRQFNDQLGFNYTNLDQQGNSSLMSLIQTIVNRG